MNSDHPYIIQPYLGFGNQSKYLIKGRVLENDGVIETLSDSKLKNLFETFKRIETDEIPGAKVKFDFLNSTTNVVADKEGYFEIVTDHFSKNIPSGIHSGKIELLEPNVPEETLSVECAVLFPDISAKYGIISDVDDTVLQTHMTSRMMLKMMYVSFLKGAHQRLPMEGMKAVLDVICEHKNGISKHPIFYVSNSPYNIYDVLSDFINIQELPKGPLMLRDFGMNLIFKKNNFVPRKLKVIRQILSFYPELPFLCLGDTASNDADYYLQLSDEFPGQIKGVFIRETKDNKNARRIRSLLDARKNAHFKMVKSSDEILEAFNKIQFL